MQLSFNSIDKCQSTLTATFEKYPKKQICRLILVVFFVFVFVTCYLSAMLENVHIPVYFKPCSPAKIQINLRIRAV